VIGKSLTDGVLPTTDDIAYGGEPTGTVWGAYMALEYVVGDRRYAYLTETVDVMGVAFGPTVLAFGAAGASALRRRFRTPARCWTAHRSRPTAFG